MLRRDKILVARDKFVQRLGGKSRLEELADDLSNIESCLHFVCLPQSTSITIIFRSEYHVIICLELDDL